MLDEATKAKLRDPAYFALHTQAAAAIRAAGRFDWYDSNFLRRFEAAKLYLRAVRPDSVSDFVEGFEPIRPPQDFHVTEMDDLFDDETRNRILEISRSAQPGETSQDAYERTTFGRVVIWDEPYFLDLQRDLVARVSDIAGRRLVPGYNFLSLYGGEGVCDPHMDEPFSMYTLDYCIEQSEEWPICFSKTVDWPTLETMDDWDAEAIKNDASLQFEAKVLQPNQAVFFSGSSQWHYRDPIPAGGFCSLLFFHYYPEGCEGLVTPSQWAAHFDIPELGPMCALFSDAGSDGFQ